jgi:hypothetical protein
MKCVLALAVLMTLHGCGAAVSDKEIKAPDHILDPRGAR